MIETSNYNLKFEGFKTLQILSHNIMMEYKKFPPYDVFG